MDGQKMGSLASLTLCFNHWMEPWMDDGQINKINKQKDIIYEYKIVHTNPIIEIAVPAMY